MIDVNNVSVELSKKRIVEDVTLNVQEGELIGIIGPNGSGKSTLLKSIYRFLKTAAGEIEIDGTDIEELSLKECAKKTAVVTQHNAYNFNFRVRDVIMMGRSPHKKGMEMENAEDHRIVGEAMDTVGMTDMADRSFHTLSGGEQQRVVLARALAQQTKCLLLDEPTNHLDIKYQLQLMDIVKGLRITALAALHDLNIAAAYCDRLYLMYEGNIVETGTPEEVLTEENLLKYYGVRSHISISPNTGLVSIEYHPGFIRSGDQYTDDAKSACTSPKTIRW